MERAECQTWLDAYARAWEARDPDAAAVLFTDDAVYSTTPFSDPLKGRDAVRSYWSHATSAQEHIRCGCEPVAGFDGGWVARWRTSLVDGRSSHRVRMDGIFLLTFTDGLCDSLMEWWHSEEEAAP